MVGSMVEGGCGCQGASPESRGLWAMGRSCWMWGKPHVCLERGGSQSTAQSLCVLRPCARPSRYK